jgi:SSS family transporter
MHPVDYIVVGSYLLLMVVIGLRTQSSSANLSDYVRMGNKSTWWLAGFSLFMSQFSATTFTGLAGSAYIAGWSIMVSQLVTALGFFLQAFWIAPLLRRTRAITPMDVVRSRFGPAAEQLKVYISTLSSFFFAGFFLLGFGTFASALFGLPLWVVVVVMGLIVVFYSVSGGSWSVQITDSLQALILIPVTIAFSLLCLHKIGGIDGLFDSIEAAGLTRDFSFVKPQGYDYVSDLPVREGNFTWLWIMGSVLNAVIVSIGINTSHRYLSLKDEASSSKAAVLAGILTLFGAFIWYVPPIVGRLLFADDISAVQGIPNPADAAYAITALKLLPPGLMGLIFVCMMAATMSSMDGFLTGTAGFIVRNLYQPLARTLKFAKISDARELSVTRMVNLALGLWAIVMSFVLNRIAGSSGMFEVLQTVITLIGAPTSIPFALSLICRRIPLWGLFAGMLSGVAVSITLFVLRSKGITMQWGYETLLMTSVCVLPTIVSMAFWKHTSSAFRDHVDRFFKMIETPIVVRDEVGEGADSNLLRMVGLNALAIGALELLLLIWCNNRSDVYTVLGIGAFLFSVGGIMLLKSRRNAEMGI